MTTKDATANAAGGGTTYRPSSPYRSAKITVDLGEYALAASGGDTLNLIPINKGEFVHAAYFRVDSPSDSGVTLKIDDDRTGGGAILGATAADSAAGTTSAASGAGVGKVGTTDGNLTMTTGAAVATTQGKVTVYAIIGEAF